MIIIQIILLTSLALADSTDDCDLPDDPNTSYLHLTADGSVLYKSLYYIGGCQFFMDD